MRPRRFACGLDCKLCAVRRCCIATTQTAYTARTRFASSVGSVSVPAIYELRGRENIAQALSLAGGASSLPGLRPWKSSAPKRNPAEAYALRLTPSVAIEPSGSTKPW